MKVILLKDIKGVGKKGEVINASDGYVRNFLIPRKFAEEANKNNLHILNKKNEKERKKKLEEIQQAQKEANELKGKEIKIEVKAGENGRLFGAITTKDIAKELEKQYKVKVDKKKIVTDALKQLGTYEVEIKLYPEVSTKVKIMIMAK